MKPKSIVVICGGVGAARLLRAFVRVVEPETLTAVINVADDMVLHGLSISPDIDTVTYTLADAIDPDRGWGLRDESWRAMESIKRYGDGSGDWFSLGDHDLATHLYRTGRLADGASLTQVTTEIAQSWGVDVTLLPVTNDPVSTRVTLAESGEEVSFQEYFVGQRHSVEISDVQFDGVDDARITGEVAAALATADVIVVAPSNPIVSIGPTLAVPGLREALTQSTAPVIAVSPIIGGNALKGPAAAMMTELGHDASVVGVAALWQEFVDVLLIDDADAPLAQAVCGCGVIPFVTDTIMASAERGARLATAILSAAHLAGPT